SEYGPDGRTTHSNDQFSLRGYNSVVSYPDGVVPVGDTIARYRWRFRQHALAAQQSHGVSADRVNHALAELGASREAFVFGAGLVIACGQDLNVLPERTTVRTGRPEHWDTFGVHVLRDGRWRHVFGPHGRGALPVTVERFAGVNPTLPDWLSEAPTEEDARQIAAFKV